MKGEDVVVGSREKAAESIRVKEFWKLHPQFYLLPISFFPLEREESQGRREQTFPFLGTKRERESVEVGVGVEMI